MNHTCTLDFICPLLGKPHSYCQLIGQIGNKNSMCNTISKIIINIFQILFSTIFHNQSQYKNIPDAVIIPHWELSWKQKKMILCVSPELSAKELLLPLNHLINSVAVGCHILNIFNTLNAGGSVIIVKHNLS